jgi:hypothetical protein
MSSAIPHFPHSQITRDQRGVYTLQIIDAKSMNVLGTPVTQGLTEAAQWLTQQSDARAVIIRGTGDKSFIGGANIFEMGGLDSAGAHAFITNLRKLCDAARAIPVPTVARISGYCLGAGLEVAAACDIRLGSDQAQFGMPEVRVGIPSVIHALLHRTSDGYISLLPYTDGQWQRFFTLAGRPDLAQDQQYASARARSRNFDTLYQTLGDIVATRTTQQWMDLLENADIPMAPVHQLTDVLNDPHLAATGFFQRFEHPTEGNIRLMGIPVKFSRTPGKIRRLPPRQNADREQVQAELYGQPVKNN